MNCDECLRRESEILKAIVAADKAESAMRWYLVAHLDVMSSSDIEEYNALKLQEQQACEARHLAFTGAIAHRRRHTAAA